MYRNDKKISNLPVNFASQIRGLRVKYELTQTRLAELLGVSFATVNRWENGQSKPSRISWQRLLRIERYGLEALSSPSDAYSPYTNVTIIKEEPNRYEVKPEPTAIPDFTSDPEIVRIVVEGHRLTYGHLFNPAFATEISRIDPLPHQRIAVYEHMLLLPRLRFLLADDAGAGKTIMSGLYIREMLTRRLIRRVLIVPPSGLLGNWEREMRQLFSLPFRVIRGAEAKAANPFKGPGSDLLIVSIDTLAGDRMLSRLQEWGVEPYELVIFDEAHKLSARRDPDGTFRATDRYRLAETLAGINHESPKWQLDWSARHLLLLTATPHMGKDFPYYCLWRLLEPEVLSTFSAFSSYPKRARDVHFIRRAKEEMVHYDGTPIYPERISDTLSYDLSKGEFSEQAIYDITTHYIQTYYNKARLLNRSAACFAMSIFQRRLASSTYALLCSFKRRLAKLDAIMDDIQSGRITPEKLAAMQRKLDDVEDVSFTKTADEETSEDDQEEHEAAEEQALGGTIAANLADLEVERIQVRELLDLAQKVYDGEEESKFERLLEVFQDPKFKNEKFIIFTEYRDTLVFLVRRLEGLGYTGRVAQIHGGMDYRERDEQVEFFRKPEEEGGARYLVATDAAGEGINLQFCWIMTNYDIPWNPARLEQRMGRIHRYGQKHDPVLIINLVAAKTREGRVLKTLLDKLENIRKELRSDKVFDVIGRVFEDISIKDYMEKAITDEGAREAADAIEGLLTEEQIRAIEERERILYGEGGDVRKELPRLQDSLGQEIYWRLLPGYVRGFVQKATPLVHIGIEGDLDSIFSFRAIQSCALDGLWPSMETYPEPKQNRLTVYRNYEKENAIFLHPGEPVFDALCENICRRFASKALRGGVFVDASAERPYFFHLALVKVERRADPALKSFADNELIEYRLVGLKQEQDGQVEECPIECLLLLKGEQGLPPSSIRFAATAKDAIESAREFAIGTVAMGLAEGHKQALINSLPERENFIRQGFDYQEAELAAHRVALSEKVRAGEAWAKQELLWIKERQRKLSKLREQALNVLKREPELIEPAGVEYLVHALVVPSSNPEDRMQQDQVIEEIAIKVACLYEESLGATAKNVSNPSLARKAGLLDWPGFDLLSIRKSGEERAIEVKGRAQVGDIEISENEWAKACNLRDRYWLYVVYNCASAYPKLVRVQDPFGKLLVRAKGGMIIEEREILEAGETRP
jgi:superfamily II DNA or RNA helicase/DNA-binding XRE family transcriptional regulator